MTIGRGAAVADLNWLELSGWPAWLIWVFIHLLYIIQFQNRLLAMMQWLPGSISLLTVPRGG